MEVVRKPVMVAGHVPAAVVAEAQRRVLHIGLLGRWRGLRLCPYRHRRTT